MLLDDLIDELRDRSVKPDESALSTDEGGNLLEAIEFRSPRLRVRDDL